MDETRREKSPDAVPDGVLETPSSPLKQIRTFQGDVASALKNQNESLFSIQQTERLKKISGGTPIEASSTEDKNRKQALIFIFGGLLLLILGGSGAWFGYSQFLKQTTPPVIITPANRLVAVQKEVALNFASTTRETLLSTINEEAADNEEEAIMHVVMRQGSWKDAELVTSEEFLKKMEVSAPSSLIRALHPHLMLGAVGEKRFIIIKIDSFENAFPGMLSWEQKLPQDLGGIFSTAPLLKTSAPQTVFKDVVSKNKDVRVLYSTGSTSEPVLLYSFFENKMLIITENLPTLRILIDRLTQELLSR